LGWWDDHIVPNPIFQITKKEGSTPPTENMLLVNIDATGKVVGHIEWVPGVPTPSEKGGLGLMVDGQITHHVSWK
jgi:hypothetical protein